MIELSYRQNGFIFRLEDQVDQPQMREFTFQMRDEWAGMNDKFVVLVDARKFKNFSADAQAGFEELLEEADECGMVRITVLAISTALASLFCSVMVQTDLMGSYQFLDLAYEADWKAEMREWLDAPFAVNNNQI